MKKNKGFTLIELLVVIAIIGILASVVLASLSSARVKGADSAVKANLNSIRGEAEIYYLENGTYIDLCTRTSKMLNEAKNSANNGGNCFVQESNSWAAWAGLKSDVNKAWCVDSVGNSQQITKPLSGGDTLFPCSN